MCCAERIPLSVRAAPAAPPAPPPAAKLKDTLPAAAWCIKDCGGRLVDCGDNESHDKPINIRKYCVARSSQQISFSQRVYTNE